MIPAAPHAEIVSFSNANGPLTKRILLDEAGILRSDGSACRMARGVAQRTPITCIGDLAAVIGGMQSDQAIALGSLWAGLPGTVEITTKRKLNGGTLPGLISRTADNIVFPVGALGFAMLDHDTKGMPGDIAARLNELGGFWPALLSVLPVLGGIARVSRASTSAGLYRTDNGASVAGSNGMHVYIALQNVADSARFLKSLHERCWLAGFGWMMVGVGGQMLERSIIDRMVGAPERLVFEGPPILVEPLAQEWVSRRPVVREGDWLDTIAECPPLTVVDKARLDDLRIRAAHRLANESAKARETFVGAQAERLAKRSGMSVWAGRAVVAKQCGGTLLPSVELPFDDPELAGKTVADVLADPAAFEGETLADPLEGIEYGRCKARIMRRADGMPWINSFAHGRTTYELKLDAAAIRAAIAAADVGDVAAVLAELLTQADVEPPEQDALVTYAKERTGAGKRMIERQIKSARETKAKENAEETQRQRMAARDDPRPMIEVPASDAEWLPPVGICNDVLSRSTARIPPTRGVGTEMALACRVEIAGLSAFSQTSQE
jgi:hypothetical protein